MSPDFSTMEKVNVSWWEDLNGVVVLKGEKFNELCRCKAMERFINYQKDCEVCPEINAQPV